MALDGKKARMCVFTARSAKLMNLAYYTLKTVKFAEKHGQRIAYSWFNSVKNYTKKIFL